MNRAYAMAKSLKAYAVYRAVLDQYRARKIGDAEFEAARNVYAAARKAFERFSAMEAGWQPA